MVVFTYAFAVEIKNCLVLHVIYLFAKLFFCFTNYNFLSF